MTSPAETRDSNPSDDDLGLDPPTPTINAIYAAYEVKQESGYRDHLGASLIGQECKRAIWYTWRWMTRAQHAGRLLRLFATGNLAEDRFVIDLRSVGVTVMEVDPDTGRQWAVRDKETGHFGGSMDGKAIGLLEAPRTLHLVEFKTHSAKSFAALKKQGVQASKPPHYAQIQVYMHFGGLTRAYYMAVNKDTDDLYQERVALDKDYAQRMVERAQSIIRSPSPPAKVSDDPAWWVCRFCDHAPACHGTAMPERHCRSCLHSTPVEDGKWHCGSHNTPLFLRDQRNGCTRHRFIPSLVHGEQIDAADDGAWVLYRMADGGEWRDGE